MRMTNVAEFMFFMVGFLVLCLVILTRRAPQPVPVSSALATSPRVGIEG